MGAYSECSKLFKDGIVSAAKSLNYSLANILVLEGSIDVLMEKHPDTYQNLISCRHHRDKRTPLEYGRDIVATWIFEDTLISKLKQEGLDISHNGADKNREILENTRVSASSDAKVNIDGVNYVLEIMCDYTGWWSRHLRCDLRDQKYKELVKSKSLFLGISTRDKLCFLVDFSLPQDVIYHNSHAPYGGKPAYSFKVPKMIKFKMDLICQELKTMVKDARR